jgi:ABC-type sugar transport system ATPase subunit
MTMADRIVVMSKGKIEQLGTPPEIYNHPMTQFVAGFFGTPTMTFVEGVVEIGAAGARFCGTGREQVLPASVSANLCGRKVVLGVGSEHVLIGDAAASSLGTVRILRPLGDATLVHFDAEQGQSLVAKVEPSTELVPGLPLIISLCA